MTGGSARSRWVLPIGIATTILLASVAPLPGSEGALPVVPLGITTWLHAVGYAALAASLSRATGASGRPARTAVALAAVATMGFGVGIELLQTAVPTRGFAWADVTANAAGVALGGAGWWRSRRRYTTPTDSGGR